MIYSDMKWICRHTKMIILTKWRLLAYPKSAITQVLRQIKSRCKGKCKGSLEHMSLFSKPKNAVKVLYQKVRFMQKTERSRKTARIF